MDMVTNMVLLIAHGDLDGVTSAALLARKLGLPGSGVKLLFTQPFLLDKVRIPDGTEKIYVVDIARNNKAPEMTRDFIVANSDRLAGWYDHHQGWPEEIVRNTLKFVVDASALCCAELVGGDAAMVADAAAADTRKGALSPRGELIDRALKADMQDDAVKRAAVLWLMGDAAQEEILSGAAAKYAAIEAATDRLAAGYRVLGNAAIVEVGASAACDITRLLLAGQKLARFAVVCLTGKAPGESQIIVATKTQTDLVKLFGLPSGAAGRVALRSTDLPEIINKLKNA